MCFRVVSRTWGRIAVLSVVVLICMGCAVLLRGDRSLPDEWPTYGNDPGGTRYSALTQIDRANVASLRVAWTYRTGERGGAPPYAHVAFEATPLMLDGTLYLSTPYNRVIALDAETGAEQWAWDAKVDPSRRLAIVTSRGVSAWLDGAASRSAACRWRILVGTIDARLIALDAGSGTPCADFGRGGTVDLKEGIKVIDRACCYQVTSPPAVVNGLVVVGSSIGDNRTVETERGVVRAYDARTGALRWSWDPIPTRESDPARATWAGDSWRRTGAANVWSVMSVDAERGLIFVPTSSPSPDHYGGERIGANRYANSVVALRAATGEVVGRPPRSLGLRRARSARARHRLARRQAGARGRGRDEDGTPLRAASRDGRAPLSRRGAWGPAQHGTRRGRLADAAVPNPPPGPGAVTAHGRRRLGHHASRA